MRGFTPVLAFGILGLIGGCDDEQAATQAPMKMFIGKVSGDFEGKVQGGGVLTHLPDAGYDARGYYFLADGAGLRDLGVTFVLPNHVATGLYPIDKTGPMETGETFSVRIDRDLGTSIHSMQKNAEGYLDITRFPATGEKGPVTGSYDVRVEDGDGKSVRVTGVFDFEAK